MKRDKIIYWVSTGLVSIGFLLSSIMYLTSNPELMKSFSEIGFPVFFVTILGISKLTGAIALVNPWMPKLREWAYAGFTFTLIGAVWTHVATNTPFIAPLFFMLLLGISYFFSNRIRKTVTNTVL
ncbi:MAG: DoxX family protein [Flavipsychrobacter sp.]|nr:DoxX family protein [Flavipsychrobacter sp.]